MHYKTTEQSTKINPSRRPRSSYKLPSTADTTHFPTSHCTTLSHHNRDYSNSIPIRRSTTPTPRALRLISSHTPHKPDTDTDMMRGIAFYGRMWYFLEGDGRKIKARGLVWFVWDVDRGRMLCSALLMELVTWFLIPFADTRLSAAT
jgi:hypothetical protein